MHPLLEIMTLNIHIEKDNAFELVRGCSKIYIWKIFI